MVADTPFGSYLQSREATEDLFQKEIERAALAAIGRSPSAFSTPFAQDMSGMPPGFAQMPAGAQPASGASAAPVDTQDAGTPAPGGPGPGAGGTQVASNNPLFTPPQPAAGRADLVSLETGGGPVTVSSVAAQDFQGLLADLKQAGAPLGTIGSYNYRPIAGTNILSEHGKGLAIDIGNQRGRNLVSPEFMAWYRGFAPDGTPNRQRYEDILRKHNMRGGENFRDPDLGHIEWTGRRGPDYSGGLDFAQSIRAIARANPGIRPEVLGAAIGKMLPMWRLQSEQQGIRERAAHNAVLEELALRRGDTAERALDIKEEDIGRKREAAAGRMKILQEKNDEQKRLNDAKIKKLEFKVEPTLSDAAAKMIGDIWIAGDTKRALSLIPGGRSELRQANQNKVNEYIASKTIDPKTGVVGAETVKKLIQNATLLGGENQKQRTLGQMTARLGSATGEVNRLMPQAIEAANAVYDQRLVQKFPTLNKFLNASAAELGDPKVVELQLAMAGIASAYAAVLRRGMGTTDEAMRTAFGLLSKDWNEGQIIGAMRRIKIETDAVNQSLRDMQTEFKFNPAILDTGALKPIGEDGLRAAQQALAGGRTIEQIIKSFQDQGYDTSDIEARLKPGGAPAGAGGPMVPASR